MQKFLYIFFLVVFSSSFCNGQTLSQQLTQQNWLEARKDSFIGKSFNVLYNALAIKPKSVLGGTSHANRFFEFCHNFYYISPLEYKNFSPFFYIEWTEPILNDTAQQFQNRYFRAFNSQEYPIYANKVIRKIKVVYPAD